MIDERHEELAALYAFDLLEGAELASFETALAADPAQSAAALLIRNARKRGVDNGMVPGVALLESARQLLKASGR